MNRSQRLKPVVALAEREETQLAQAYTQQLQQLQAARDKRQQLLDYRLDYAAMAKYSAGHIVNLVHLQGARAFLQRLGEAIAMQEAEIRRLDGLAHHARSQWLAARRHQHSLCDLVTRYQVQEHRLRDKREQGSQDDLAAQRMAWRINADAG